LNTFMTHIYEADNNFFEGELVSLVVPVSDGEYGILAHHQNTVMAISAGMVRYTLADGTEKYAAVSDGMLRVENNDVLILVDSAEHPEEIDMERMRQKEAAMREAILQKKSIQEYYMAEASLRRAMNRLKVGSRHTPQ